MREKEWIGNFSEPFVCAILLRSWASEPGGENEDPDWRCAPGGGHGARACYFLYVTTIATCPSVGPYRLAVSF